MSTPSPQPTEAKQYDKVHWENRAAQLKQRLMERRILTAVAQPEKMSFPQDAPEQSQQEKQPPSDRAGPIQTMTTAVPQAQFIPGLSHKLPVHTKMLKETSKPKQPSILNAPEQSTPNGNAQSSAAITGKTTEMLSPSTSKTIGNDINDTPMVMNEVRRVTNMPSGTTDRIAITVQEETEAGTCSKAQQGDDSTARTEELASRSSTKSMVTREDGSNPKLSTNNSEITPKSSAPVYKDPVHEPKPQHASRKNTNLIRVSTGNSVVPVKTRAERRVSGPLDATPSSKHGGAQGDRAPARSSAFRSEGRNENRRASSSVRERRTDRNDHVTWDPYKASPLEHLAYPKAGREQSRRPGSPAAPWLIDDDEDREVEMLASRYPDFQDWLKFTGWHDSGYRMRQLDRLRRMADVDHMKSQLEEEFESERAQTKVYGEPVRLGRRRIEESDDKDGDFSRKYYRTNRNERGSRAGYHGSRGPIRRGGGRSPSFRGSPKGSPRRYLPQRSPRATYRLPSEAGHSLPRNDLDAERWYMTRDRSQPRHLSPRFGSSPYQFRGYSPEP